MDRTRSLIAAGAIAGVALFGGTALAGAEDEVDDEVGELSGHQGDRPVNHGQVVSDAARSTEPGPGHGEAVSDVARSDAGKSHTDEGDEPAAETSETETEETEDSEETDDSNAPAQPEQAQNSTADKS